MKKLVIIGAGGFGKEVTWLVEDINSISKEWDLIGFIDENTSKHGKVINNYLVLGDFDYCFNLKISEPIYAVCAVSNPRNKIKLIIKAMEWGYQFVNLIHPSVRSSRYVKIGSGNIICVGNIITTDVVIGNHVSINPGCGIGHDVVIGDYSTLLWNVNLSGSVKVDTGCEIGTKVVAIQGVNISKWSIIGAGAIVVRDIPPYSTAVGVPAKPIKFNNIDNLIT